jgi:2-C-methyl-D-erythritol 2,4-cyclodiphosphate synthase
MNRKLRYGMIGGGRGAFIGAVHRTAAQMDGQAELVAGAFSSDPVRSAASGEDFFLDPSRVYGSYAAMAAAESKKPAGQRLDFVVIVTPNHQHFPPAKLFLEAGFNVVCDKPVTFDLTEAITLQKIVRKTRKVFVLTHNYTGNTMVKQARDLVRTGKLGTIRKVVVEYPQGWLSTALEKTDQKQAAWRTDPKRSGAAGCMGDIGTHFPDTDSAFKGADSLTLLSEAARLVRAKGYAIVNVDSTVIAQAPKLAPHIPAMRQNIAQALGIDLDCVNVKAKTAEKMGPVGEGLAVEARAVVLLEGA